MNLSDTLRDAINNSDQSFKALERDTGVLRQSLMKFSRGETSLRLDMADKLAAYFGIEVQAAAKKAPAKAAAKAPAAKPAAAPAKPAAKAKKSK